MEQDIFPNNKKKYSKKVKIGTVKFINLPSNLVARVYAKTAQKMHFILAGLEPASLVFMPSALREMQV